MHNKKIILLLSASFLMLLFSCLVFNNRKNRFLIAAIEEKHAHERQRLNQRFAHQNSKYILINEAEGLKVENVKLLSHELQEVMLGDIAAKGPKLVFRFPPSDCRPCINQTLKNYNKLQG